MLLSLTTFFLATFSTLTSASSSPSPWGTSLKPPASHGKICIVRAHGNKTNDTPQILKGFEECNGGGTLIFPENESYYIATRLNPVVHDLTIEWRGLWTLSDDLDYWRNHSYPIAFQNHHAAFIITGERISINGNRTGGIYGNGNAWYDAEEGTTLPGRPMPFVFWNVSDVFVQHFSIKDSPLWQLNIMNGTNMWFDDMIMNSTAVNAPFGDNWVQNTDGFDTMDANNITMTNMVYQGGDDCIAIKPRSYNIFVQNVTCHGGNGIAIGSLGQYLEDSSVINVTFKDVNIPINNNDSHGAAYIKTWVGALVPQTSYESGGLPRGGGWGVVKNITFQNFWLEAAAIGPQINQNSGDNGSYAGTSLMQVSDIVFLNFTGHVATTGNRTAAISCSEYYLCFDILLEDISLAVTTNGTAEEAIGTCTWVEPGGVVGMVGSGC
ncbi:hypothetical protein B7494_g7614 [Chlorociboria aeruginascens]|nr:hypothetical protein B7494_g7614 [Chlorociboria aeruginascens]